MLAVFLFSSCISDATYLRDNLSLAPGHDGKLAEGLHALGSQQAVVRGGRQADDGRRRPLLHHASA